MPYILGFSPRNSRPGTKVDEAVIETATKALVSIDGLIRSDEVVRYIKTGDGRPMFEWQLKEEAEREAKEAAGA